MIPWPSRMFFVRWLAAPRNTSGAELWRVLLEEVVLDLPRVVVAEPVGELDLVEAVLEQLVLAVVGPRARELVLVEDPEPHGRAVWCTDRQRATTSRTRPVTTTVADARRARPKPSAR